VNLVAQHLAEEFVLLKCVLRGFKHSFKSVDVDVCSSICDRLTMYVRTFEAIIRYIAYI